MNDDAVTEQEVIDRLKDQVPSLEGRVFHALAITEHEFPETDSPLALVMEMPHAIEQRQGIGMLHEQPYRVRMGIWLRAYRTPRDANPLRTVSREMFETLLGWPGDHRAFEADDSPEQPAPEGHLVTWAYSFSYLDHLRVIR